MIGERAGAFCDEWFGDDPKVLEKILSRVLVLAPSSESALQRLSVIYTVAERWADVLALYDRAIDATQGQVARACACCARPRSSRRTSRTSPRRRSRTTSSCCRSSPTTIAVSQSLERLLERHERWAGSDRAVGRPPRRPVEERAREEPRADRRGVARQPRRSAERARRGQAAAQRGRGRQGADARCSSASSRRRRRPRACATPRSTCCARTTTRRQRPREVIRVLEKIIQIDPTHSRELREEAGQRLAELDDVPAAMDHYAALLAIAPESQVTEEKLRSSPSAAAQHDRYGAGRRERGAHGAEHRSDPQGRAARRGRAHAARADVRHRRRDRAARRGVRGQRRRRDTNSSRSRAGSRRCTRRPIGRRSASACSSARRTSKRATSRARRSSREAAKLAESLGDTDRALSLWERRVDSDPSDLSALDARIGILDNQQRWDDLVDRAREPRREGQRRRTSSAPTWCASRSSTSSSATISTRRSMRGSASSPITRTTKRASRRSPICSPRPAAGRRWRTCSRAPRVARRSARSAGSCGSATRCASTSTNRPARSPRIATRSRSIRRRSKSRAGLTALLDVATTRAAAADALAQAMRTTNDVAGVLDLLPARLAEAKDDKTRLALLREAAQLRLEHKHDAAGALADLSTRVPARAARSADREPARVARALGQRLHDARHRVPRSDRRARRRSARGRAPALRVRRPRRRSPERSAAGRRRVSPGRRRRARQSPRRFRRSPASARRLGQWNERRDRDRALHRRARGVRRRAARDPRDRPPAMQSAQRRRSRRRSPTALDKHKLPGAVAALFHHRLAALHRDQRKRQAAPRSRRCAARSSSAASAWRG